MERLQISAFAGTTGNYSLEGKVLSIQCKPATVGIAPQSGIKFCNFRTQKAVFLDHFVLEQPANQVRTFLLSLPSKRKRKKFQRKLKTCLFESATRPMGAPEVNLPEKTETALSVPI